MRDGGQIDERKPIMSKYIAESVLKQVVKRLNSSEVKGSPFFAYLILRRHVVLQGSPDELSITGKELSPAAQEAGLVDNSSSDYAYFSPLEGKYRKKRWGETNGPSDAINRWVSRDGGRDLVEKLEDRKVMTIRLLPFDPQAAVKLFNLKQSGRPDCTDFALWWYRSRDVTQLLDSQGELKADVVQRAFMSDLALDRDEVETLFSSPSAYASDAVIPIADVQANPKDYLPLPQARRAKEAEYLLKTYDTGSCQQLIDAVHESGYIFSESQVATFLTAVRTKPFLILAGVSGTGKTHLPITIAKATGSAYQVAPVAPSWIDSSQLVGYRDIEGTFHPGPLLLFAKKAQENPETEHFFILDEMNLARVEYYLSEVLSCMETMEVNQSTGRLESSPIAPESDSRYRDVGIPSNLCFIGSVNMDESTQPISKKVLDRAFILEFNDVDLTAQNKPARTPTVVQSWTAADWGADRIPLFGTCGLETDEFQAISALLQDINTIFRTGGFNFGFRLRNEVCAFVANARGLEQYFSEPNTCSSPLDMAIKSKILTRLEGHTLLFADILKDLRDLLTIDSGGDALSDAATARQRSLNKISDMSSMFERIGYASYWA